MSLNLLEAKLKRHKIAFEKDGNKITIGKSKTDLVLLIGLVLLPIISAIVLAFYLIQLKDDTISTGRIWGGIALLFGIGAFNYKRLVAKRANNSNRKILENGMITIDDNLGSHSFSIENIQSFDFTIIHIGEDTYEGVLYLVDKTDRRFQLLGFDDESEKYVVDDLKWYSNFLMDFVKNK